MKMRTQGKRQEQLSESGATRARAPTRARAATRAETPARAETHPELATQFVPSTRCGAVEHPIPDRSTRRGGRETGGAASLRGRIV